MLAAGTLAAAGRVVAQALAVALQAEALAALAALALRHGQQAPLDLGEKLLLRQRLPHDCLEGVLKLALVQLVELLALSPAHVSGVASE